jgi:hypothetical protein
VRRQPSERFIGYPCETRTQQRSRTHVGQRVGEIPQKCEHVLDFVGIEKAKALVDIRADATLLERRLELTVRVAGPEQDSDIGRRHPARNAGRLVADDGFRFKQARNFGSGRAGTRVGAVTGDQAEW